MAGSDLGVYARGGMVVESVRRRAVPVSPRAREWLLVGGFALWGALEQLLNKHNVSQPVGLVLLLVVLVPLLVSKRHPFCAAVLLGLLAPLRAASGGAAFPDVTPLQICVVVVWAQGRYARDLRLAGLGTLIAVVGVVAGLAIAEPGRAVGAPRLIVGGLFFACVMAAGALARQQSEEARAERASREALELDREQRVREALVGERSRIARELHDLVAHGVAAISVQAGVAEQWLERDPSRAEVALRNARRRARTVLAEMRRLLSVLRDDDAVSGGAGAASIAADPGFAAPSTASVRDAWPSFVADVLPALALVAYGAIELALVRSSAPAVARLVGAAAFGVAVFVRRVAPVPAAGAFALVLVLRAADGQLAAGSHAPTLGLLILGWSLGTGVGSGVSRLAALALLEAGVAVALPLGERHAVPTDFVVLGLLPLAAFGAGTVLRRWRAGAQLERARQREVATESKVHPRRAVVQERARVARELHDVVAHSVSIISVQAGAAEALARRDPLRAREAVEAVLAAAHQALAELRRLLDLLSSENADGASYGPQPGLAGLDELIANAREMGLEIDLLDERAGAELPAGVQLTAFRVVQEALTNAHKHAGSVPVVVRLAGRPGELEIEVRSEMTPTSTSRGGSRQGLVGMRERVRLYGGSLDTGPDGDGRWLVRAVLPIEAELPG
jgi:signal transduction histidine kinase